MAIFPLPTNSGNAPASAVDVEAWTEDAVQAMNNLAVSAGPVQPISGFPLEIPLDERTVRVAENTEGDEPRTMKPGYVRRREPMRRDSMKRREALLKGKEGSRRRQRWENDRLLSNPYVQPPLPADWEVRPTHPVHSVPYFLAGLWDAELAARSAARKNKPKSRAKGKASVDTTGTVPKDLREKLKRSRGAKGLLQDLEEEVRGFVEKWEEKEREKDADIVDDPDTEDEEIVFVGRDGRMNDVPPSPTFDEDEFERYKLVFDSLADDHGASFGRFLVHCIGHYYGLSTWSVTVGDPARREAYVGIKEPRMKAGRGMPVHQPLPQPLWGMV